MLFADAGLEYIIQNGLGYDPHGYFAQPPTLDDIKQVLGIQVHSSFRLERHAYLTAQQHSIGITIDTV